MNESIKSKTKPWPHQERGYTLIAERSGLILNWEMGCGKTKPVVDWICNNHPPFVLVLTPKRVIQVWPEQFLTHGLSADHEVLALDNNRPSDHKQRMAEQFVRSDVASHVLVLNYESARQGYKNLREIRRGSLGHFILTQHWDLIVEDEIHRIKSPSGITSRFCAELRRRNPKVIGLTGTLMPHSPLDAWAQMRAVDPNLFSHSYVRYRLRYAVMGGFEGKQVIGWSNQDELSSNLKRVCDVVKKDEVLDLPLVTHERVTVVLGAKAMKVYNDLETEMIAHIESGVITPANGLVKLLRLQQITGGTAVTEGGGHQRIDKSKFEALNDLIQGFDRQEPIVIFARFKDDLSAIRMSAYEDKRRPYELSGQADELAEWKQDDGGSVLGVQVQAGGLGVDLTRARYAIFYSVGFSLGDFDQCCARLDRPGQLHKVTIYHLVARGTVDVKIYAALRSKRNVVEAVIEGMRK